jgi:hypothetical protein
MGKKLNRTTKKIRVMMIEALEKSINRGSDYDNGYAQGMFDVMRVLDDERMGRESKWFQKSKEINQ